MYRKLPAAALTGALLLSLTLPAAALDAQEARSLLEQHYIDPLPAAALRAETVEELLSAVGDPYTVYYTPAQYRDFLTSIDGETLVGIGVSIRQTYEDGFELLSIFPNSPAQEAGLKAGDFILGVDGVTFGPADTPGAHISGAEGTALTLTVRTTAGEVRDVTLTRRVVHVPTVTWKQVGGAGFIDCDSFGGDAPNLVRQAIAELGQDTAAWVLDLRKNPGGTSNAAANMAGAFLGPGAMVYFRDSAENYYKSSASALNEDLTTQPLIILTDSRSASASELFAAAVRDHRGGIAIGQRTYGKGVAQKVYDQKKYPELFDGDALKVTTYRFFSPRGATNHLVGVIPTLLVEPAHTETAARILSAPRPERSLNTWMLQLCGQKFYLDQELCQAEPQAFQALLEALPPSAKLYRGTGTNYWRLTDAWEAAREYDLPDYAPRTFADLEGHPYQREINTLYTYDLVSGTGEGQFSPDLELTRAQLAAMLASALNLPAGEETFSDVPADAWYAGAVSAMAARGFLSGTGEGRFSPDAPLTRQEFYTVLSAVAAWSSTEGYKWSQTDVSAVQWAEFYDYPEWAQGPARNLDELGLTIERTDPTAHVTRGQAAGQLGQLLENLNILWSK